MSINSGSQAVSSGYRNGKGAYIQDQLTDLLEHPQSHFSPKRTLIPLLELFESKSSLSALSDQECRDLLMSIADFREYLSAAKEIVEAYGNQRKAKEMQQVVERLKRIPIPLSPQTIFSKALGVFLDPSDPKERFLFHLRALQNEVSAPEIVKKEPNLARIQTIERRAQAERVSNEQAIQGMSEGKKRVWNGIFSLLQLGDTAIGFSSKQKLKEVYQKAEPKKVSRQVDKEAAFVGLALGEKFSSMETMSEPEFLSFTRRFPHTRLFLDAARSKRIVVSPEEGMKQYMTFRSLPALPSIHETWNEFVSAELSPQPPCAADQVQREFALMTKELERTMGIAETDELPKATPALELGFCYPVQALERQLKESMRSLREEITPLDGLSRGGNKYRNLVLMSHLVDLLSADLVIPMPHSILSEQVHSYLREVAPEIFTHWKALENVRSLDEAGVQGHLQAIDKAIQTAFVDERASSLIFFPLPQEGSLMVRSSGAEDSKQAANAGGNLSKAYVPAKPKELCEAIGEVVRSYFSKSSLQNRLNAGLNPFGEDLKLAVVVQELIGEPLGGAKNPNEIPVSFVLFTNEPLYIGTEKFRAMRLSATYGHGEAVVSGQGIGTDTVLILHSEAQPDQLYYIYDNQPKLERLAPNQQRQLEKVNNPPEMIHRLSLRPKDLLSIYRSGVLMEAYFEDYPTDIEGVVKKGKVHFVQARPVNRKPLLPTYLEEKPEAILETLQGDVIVPGKASVVLAKEAGDILVAPTLEEAQAHYVKERHKLVIVKEKEPENSHPVVNFSSLGVPCLQVEDSSAVQRLLSQTAPNKPLAICMQRGRVHLWNTDQAPVEGQIKEGFAVHPAKIAASLPAEPYLVSGKQGTPLSLEELSIRREALEVKVKAMKHPSVEALSRLNALAELEKAVKKAQQESAVPRDGRLEQLLHEKIEKTLTYGSKVKGLSQYSLADAPQLLRDIEAAIQYQETLSHPAHATSLVLLSKNEKWKEFLLSLEPLLEEGAISQEEWASFQSNMQMLKKGGIFPFWLTFFFPSDSTGLTHFKELGKSFSSEYKQIIEESFQKIQQAEEMRAQIGRFASPKTFEQAFDELKSMVDPAYLDRISSSVSSPVAAALGYQSLDRLVDLFDLAIKTMKASSEIKQDEKLGLMKRMLKEYHSLIHALFVQQKKHIPMQRDGNWDSYTARLTEEVEKLIRAPGGSLLSSPEFSVAAAVAGGAHFEWHIPQTLEDLFTLLHQNGLVILSIANEQLLKGKSGQLLPLVKEAMAKIEGGNWGALIRARTANPNWNVQKVGTQVEENRTTIHYNVPLRQHSAHLDLEYKEGESEVILKGKFLGIAVGFALTRWKNIAAWVEVLKRMDLLFLDKHTFLNEQEVSFSWRVAPSQIDEALYQFGLMADYSFGRESLRHVFEMLYERASHLGTKKEAAEYLIEHPHSDAQIFYDDYVKTAPKGAFRFLAHCLIGLDKGDLRDSLQEVIEIPEQIEIVYNKVHGLVDPARVNSQAAISALEVLLEADHAQAAFELAKKAFDTDDHKLQIASLGAFEEIEKIRPAYFSLRSLVLPAEKKIAEKNDNAAFILRTLLKAEYYPEALKLAKKAILISNSLLQKVSFEIFERLGETDSPLFPRDFLVSAAEKAILAQSDSVSGFFTTLLKARCFKEVLQLVETAMTIDDYSLQKNAIETLVELSKIDKVYCPVKLLISSVENFILNKRDIPIYIIGDILRNILEAGHREQAFKLWEKALLIYGDWFLKTSLEAFEELRNTNPDYFPVTMLSSIAKKMVVSDGQAAALILKALLKAGHDWEALELAKKAIEADEFVSSNELKKASLQVLEKLGNKG